MNSQNKSVVRGLRKSHHPGDPPASSLRRRLCAHFATLVGTLALLTPSASGSELGAPFINTYSHRDYGAHPQNWAATQDSRGVLYFGNPEGVLEFDGSQWRVFPVSNQSIVRSLAVDSQDTLYVGAVGELGLFHADSRGQLAYVSLVDKLPTEHQAFADVWRTHVTDQGIFFFAQDRVYRWHREQFRIFELDSRFGTHLVGNRLYINDLGRGLQVFDGDNFEAVPGGEGLADLRLSLILPADDGALLVGDFFGHTFILNPAAPEGERLRPFVTEIDAELQQHKLYNGSRLPDGSYALGTLSGGALVIDRDGELLYRIDRSNGLPDASVWTTFVDRQGGLWLGLNRGLARIRVGSPITIFDERSGLGGTVEAIARHRGTLYAGTSLGLARLEDRHFQPVPGLELLCWSLLSFKPPSDESRLLVGAIDRVYEVDRNSDVQEVYKAENAFTLYQSKHDPARIFVGHFGGVSSLRFDAGRWIAEGRIEGVDHEVRDIAEDASGRLWLGTHFDGLYRLTLELAPELSVTELVHYDTEQGLPTAKGIKILSLEDEVLLATAGEGLLRFDPARDRIVPSELLGDAGTSSGASFSRLVQDTAGNLWFSRNSPASPALATQQADGTYRFDDTPFRRLPTGAWYALLPEPDGITWLGGTEGLYRFDSAAAMVEDSPFSTLVRRVTLANGEALYAGARSAAIPGSDNERINLAPLPYEHHNLTFRFSALAFDDPDANRFSYQLEGNDQDWSPWSPTTHKEYTNLPEGDYRFRVRGKNASGTTGREASFAFSIRPPWYRSASAYVLYVLLVAGFAYGVAQWRSWHLAKERDQLKEQRAALERRVEETVSQIKILKGLLPICASCKKIRDDDGYWSELEVFIDSHSEAKFSHGICPDCFRAYEAQLPPRPLGKPE
ncbi:MAG: two-component regulator propeller domain-containing protein [Acidobacteriota bacterium]